MPLRTTPSDALLRRADDDAAVERHGLAERKLRVARARRQIHEQKIQLAPLDGEEKLLDGFCDHRSAPYDRLVVGDQQTDAHHFHAVIGRRHKAFGFVDGWFFVNTHHQRNAWAVNIAIQQTHLCAEMCQRAREIHGASGFADAALAAGDGDDAFSRRKLYFDWRMDLLLQWIARRQVAALRRECDSRREDFLGRVRFQF